MSMNIAGHKGDDVPISFEARKIKPDKYHKIEQRPRTQIRNILTPKP